MRIILAAVASASASALPSPSGGEPRASADPANAAAPCGLSPLHLLLRGRGVPSPPVAAAAVLLLVAGARFDERVILASFAWLGCLGLGVGCASQPL